MMYLEVHASGRGPTGESRGTPAPQHPQSPRLRTGLRASYLGPDPMGSCARHGHAPAPVQPSPSPRYIVGGNTAPGPVTGAATAGAGSVTGEAGGQCQVRLSSQSRAGGRATEVIGPHPGSRWPLGWGQCGHRQYPCEEVPGGDKPDVVGGPRQVCVQLVGYAGQPGPRTSATMLSSLPRLQGPLGSTTTPEEGATPRAPGSSTRSGRSPAHTGPGADLGQGRIHGAGSHHAGVRARRGRASPGLLRLPGPGGRQMDAGGSRDHTGQWGVGHSQDSRGSGLLTKIGGGAPGRDGLAQAGSLAWLRAAGGGSPQSSTCARAASDANARHVSARPLGESRGGCPWIPASPWDPALLRSERPDARAFLRHGRDRACVAPEPGSDLRREAWGRGPHATPPCASIGWARGVL